MHLKREFSQWEKLVDSDFVRFEAYDSNIVEFGNGAQILTCSSSKKGWTRKYWKIKLQKFQWILFTFERISIS